MARHERFNRLVRDFVDESGTVAVGIAERDGESDRRERRFTSTDDVGVTVYGGNDESEMLFERQQVLRGELQLRRVRAVAAVVLRDTLASRFIEERYIVNVGKNRDRHHSDATQSDVIHKVLASHPANLLDSRQYLFRSSHELLKKSVTYSSKIGGGNQPLFWAIFLFFSCIVPFVGSFYIA